MKKKLIIWLTNTRLWAWLLLKIIPYIRTTTYYPTIRGHKYFEGYDKLEEGDIVLCRDNKKLTTLLIGGTFTHAAFCVNKRNEFNRDFEIAEMTHEGYTKSYFFDICKEADRVVILRCLDFDTNYKRQVILKCISYQNAIYDVHFTLGVKALYCSELVYQSDYEHRLQIDLSDLAGLGRPYISPTGLYEAKNCFVVWDSDASIN